MVQTLSEHLCILGRFRVRNPDCLGQFTGRPPPPPNNPPRRSARTPPIWAKGRQPRALWALINGDVNDNLDGQQRVKPSVRPEIRFPCQTNRRAENS